MLEMTRAVIALALLVAPALADVPRTSSADRLLDLSLEELTRIDVTIASRAAEKLDRTAAAVSVITGEQIRRSGVTSIPEALRLVPGVVVARITSNQWAISCRFPDGRFSNKLLVLIDGRTVYNPIFSGTFWDQQDTLLEDVDRIEVIRGPGAAPWGSNAVAGVIHVITRSARDTKKDLTTAAVGDQDRLLAGLRHGWSLKDGGARVWAKGTQREALRFTDGSDAHDGWDTVRGGFRVDRTVRPGRELTVIGNAYSNDERTTQRFVVPAFPFERTQLIPEDASGANILGRLQGARGGAGDWSLQFYADHSTKDEALLGSRVDTFDVEYQRRLPQGRRRELTFGGDYRLIDDRVENNSPSVTFNPAHRQTFIAAAFVQERWSGRDWNVSAATRAEVNHFTGLEWQPSLRAAWFPTARGMLWGAVSRAVRLPSPAGEDTVVDVLHFPAGTFGPGTPDVVNRFAGRTGTDAETLVDEELGGRLLVTDKLHLDAVVFHGDYANLIKGVASGPPALVLGPVPFLRNIVEPRNIGRATADGAELTVQWTPRHDVRWSAGLAHAAFHVEPDFGALDAEGAGRLPRTTAHVKSEWDFAPRWELDGVTYYSDSMPSFGQPHWFRTDLHLGHTTAAGTRLELVGQNLLDSRHVEFGPEQVGAPAAEQIPRSFYARVSRSF